MLMCSYKAFLGQVSCGYFPEEVATGEACNDFGVLIQLLYNMPVLHVIIVQIHICYFRRFLWNVLNFFLLLPVTPTKIEGRS